MRSPRRRLLLLAPVLTMLLTLAAACPPAGAAAPRRAPASGAAHASGSARASATVRATVALSPRNPAALDAYARAVSTPGSPLYHRYLSVAQFARRFGPRPAQVAAVRRRLRARGLLPGSLSANGLELPVVAVPDGSFVPALARRHVAASAGLGSLARVGDGGLVQGVIGPGAPAPSASIVFGSAVRASRPRLASSATTGPGPLPCPSAQSVTAAGAHTADQIASAYGLSGYYAAGDRGSGVTIAVYELEPFSAADVAAYQACYGTNANVEVVPIDGGAGNGPGSGEAAMDIEDLIGLAPQATIRVYEAPPTGAGAYDAYSRIVSDDSAQVISTSWGLCEALEGAASAQSESTLFKEAAVQGQSLLASAGDQGSDDCGDGRQSVDDPASQPWVTAVGATSLQGTDNTVWNDALGATGGGASRVWSRPLYQGAAAQSQTSVRCGSAGGSCRELPDVSVDGDPATGYVVYWNGGWHVAGGSSVSAPTVAALTALADASAACDGHPIGFLNPGLYAAAASSAGYTGDFADVTSGVNSFDSVPGFAAGPGYDMTSGLGVPGPALGPALCGSSALARPPGAQHGVAGHGRGPDAVKASQGLRLRRLRNRSGRVGVRVRVRVRARDPRRLHLRYRASGLPTGLSINSRTGVISGRPRRPGSRRVHVRVWDSRGATATVGFRWTVTARRPARG